MKFSLFTLSLFALFACTSNTNQVADDHENLAYFYPFHTSPVVYVYQDSLSPMFEIFERIFVTEDELMGKHLWIERYNSNFILTETIEMVQLHNYNVYNHLVGIRGDLYNAEIRDSSFFPLTKATHFSSTFPSNVDSIAFHYEIKRSVLNQNGTVNWNDTELNSLTTIDSITTFAIDVKNRKEKKNTSVSNTIYAKGIGKIQVKSQNGNVNLKLTKILTDEEWKYVITK